MTIIKNPDFTATCKKCKAVLLFTPDEVFDAGGSSGKCFTREYKAIKCPCCKSIVEVWNYGLNN